MQSVAGSIVQLSAPDVTRTSHWTKMLGVMESVLAYQMSTSQIASLVILVLLML